MDFFFKRSRAANSAVPGRIMPNFILVRDIMVVLHTCKNEEDLIKNEGARGLTRLFMTFFRRSSATNSEVCGGILPKFRLIQAFIVVLVSCKNEEDQMKNEGAANKIYPIISLWEFFQTLKGSYLRSPW